MTLWCMPEKLILKKKSADDKKHGKLLSSRQRVNNKSVHVASGQLLYEVKIKVLISAIFWTSHYEPFHDKINKISGAGY